jgi:orotidine-5'-phosphate decarboxylase
MSQTPLLKNPIIVALDIDDPKEAQKLSEKLSPHVGGFKIGPRLTFRADRKYLSDLSHQGILFLDHKFFDIPSTTVSSVEVAFELGAHWVTVHALAGPDCLKEVGQCERTLQKPATSF